jgi:hypothetical protein
MYKILVIKLLHIEGQGLQRWFRFLLVRGTFLPEQAVSVCRKSILSSTKQKKRPYESENQIM